MSWWGWVGYNDGPEPTLKPSGDCPLPGCDWVNIYRTSSDGSREWEAAEHAATHEDGQP